MKSLIIIIFALLLSDLSYSACSSPISRTNNSPNTVLTSTKYNLDVNTVYTHVNNMDGDCIQDASLNKAKIEAGYKNLTVTSKTTTYAVTSSDDFIAVDASGGSFTMTLPAAASNSGKIYTIKRTDSTIANTVTLDANAAETIDGDLTRLLYTQNESYTIVSDASNWKVIEHKSITPWTTYTMTIGATTTPPTKGTVTTDLARWRRSGDCIEIRYDIVQTSAGSGGSGNYLFPVPNNSLWTIDTAKQTVGSTPRALGIVGSAWNDDGSGSGRRQGSLKAYNSTNLAIILTYTSITDSEYIGAVATLAGTNQSYSLSSDCVPITGWKE